MNSVTEKQCNESGKQNANNLLQSEQKQGLFQKSLVSCFQRIGRKMEDSWKDFQFKYAKMDQQLNKQQGEQEQKLNQKSKTTKQLKSKENKKDKNVIIQTKKSVQSATQEAKVTRHQSSFSKRVQSHNSTNNNHNINQLKSLKKTNQLPNSKDQQQKKNQRLKDIMKRKLELMEKLKKIDSQLLEVKRQSSPINEKNKNLYLSNLNKSYISSFSNSRLNNPNQNVVEQHSKAIQKLQKINNQKIKRQQKIAQQFRKKQQEQLKKVEELEKQKYNQMQQKRKKNEEYISKFLSNKNKIKKQIKLNQFPQTNQLIPTTMIQRPNVEKRKVSDGLFLDGISKKSSKNLLTERDMDFDGQADDKKFDEIIKQQEQIFIQNYKNNRDSLEKQLKQQGQLEDLQNNLSQQLKLND